MKKKRKNNRKKIPPLSFLDKSIYITTAVICVVILLTLFISEYFIRSYIAFSDESVIATNESASSILSIPMYFYLGISIIVFLSYHYTSGTIIFGNKKIRYTDLSWKKVHRFSFKKSKDNSHNHKKLLGIGLAIWMSVFVLNLVLASLSLCGRCDLDRYGNVIIRNVVNAKKEQYSPMDIESLRISTKYQDYGKYNPLIHVTFVFCYQINDKEVVFDFKDFKGNNKEALLSMLDAKAEISNDKISYSFIYEEDDDLQRAAENHNMNDEEVKLLYKLFDKSVAKTPS